MKNETRKHKIERAYRRSRKNKYSLDKKENKVKKFYPAKVLKTPKTVYDSGWVGVGEITGNLAGEGTFWLFTDQYSDREGTMLPVHLNYDIKHELKLPERLLPHVKPVIMVKRNADTEVHSIYDYTWDRWDRDEYVRIKGDSTLIYQGYDPYGEQFSQKEINDGHLLAQNTSKWYRGTIKYTINSDEYEIRSSYILRVKSYHNVVTNVFGSKDYDVYECSAFDALSDTSMNGHGTETLSRVEQRDPPSGPIEQYFYTTKNKDITVPTFEDITHVQVRGFVYKNGDYQYYTGESGITVKFAGSLNGESTLPNGEDGNATLVDWDYEQAYVTHYELKAEGVVIGSYGTSAQAETAKQNYILTGQYEADALEVVVQTYNLFKLFYDNKRTRQFNFNSLYNIVNLPDKDDYETATLPYTNFTVEVNPDPYPLLEEQEDRAYSANEIRWLKRNTNDEPVDRFFLYFSGSMIISMPATKNNGTTEDFVDETYSQSGDSYTKDATNRPDKELGRYVPDEQDIQIRYRLYITNPLYYKEVQSYLKNEI